jgi:hypothetical protein
MRASCSPGARAGPSCYSARRQGVVIVYTTALERAWVIGQSSFGISQAPASTVHTGGQGAGLRAGRCMVVHKWHTGRWLASASRPAQTRKGACTGLGRCYGCLGNGAINGTWRLGAWGVVMALRMFTRQLAQPRRASPPTGAARARALWLLLHAPAGRWPCSSSSSSSSSSSAARRRRRKGDPAAHNTPRHYYRARSRAKALNAGGAQPRRSSPRRGPPDRGAHAQGQTVGVAHV